MYAAFAHLKDWSQDVLPAIRLLRDIEDRLSLTGYPQKSFRRIGRWLISEQAITALCLLRSDHYVLRRVLAADRMNVLLTILRGGFATRIDLATRADAVLFKANLRAFYPKEKITIKIANTGMAASIARIENEKAVRAQLRGTDRIALPGLVNVPGMSEGGLVEQLLDAQRLDLRRISASTLSDLLVAFHCANGISHKRLDLFRLPEASSNLLAFCRDERIPLRPETSETLVNLQYDSYEGRFVPVTMCNGDLAISNIMQDRSRLYVLDWEWAEEAPLLVDGIRLASQIEGFGTHLRSAIDAQVKPKTDAVDFYDHFIVATVLVCNRRIARQRDFTHSVDREAYRHRLRSRIQELIALLDRFLLEFR